MSMMAVPLDRSPSDSTLERLTLDANWPSTKTVAEVDNVQFYELVRFSSDTFQIKYDRVGLAHMQAAVKAVFD